jgi:hypothetical protein
VNSIPVRKSERGQSLTELAVSFTLLVLILAVTVDLGRLFFSLIAIREAAEEGALYGSLNPTDTGGITARVRTSSSAPVNLADTATVAVSVSLTGAACAGNTLNVQVVYDFDLTMPLLGTIIGTDSFPLTTLARSTILRPDC